MSDINFLTHNAYTERIHDNLESKIQSAISNALPPQRNIGYVDLENGNDATGEIGTSKAFKTIQAFIDAVPAGNDSTSARNVYTAIIAPGDYDEDLNIDLTRRRYKTKYNCNYN
jgi:pectin methylesterase-like acyl-CoA thioesterase